MAPKEMSRRQLEESHLLQHIFVKTCTFAVCCLPLAACPLPLAVACLLKFAVNPNCWPFGQHAAAVVVLVVVGYICGLYPIFNSIVFTSERDGVGGCCLSDSNALMAQYEF